MKWLVDVGCLQQVNLYSLVKVPDEQLKMRVRRMDDARRVSFVGSDAHGSECRTPEVKDGMAYLYEHTDQAYAYTMCFCNAEKWLHV